jgi:hypothetical protein
LSWKNGQDRNFRNLYIHNHHQNNLSALIEEI